VIGEAALARAFEDRWGEAARIFHAPGRVNLIGEFTDYNDGFVMPAALALSTMVAAGKRSDRRLTIHSENFGDGREFELDDPDAAAAGHWSDYVNGVAVTLQGAGLQLSGANLLIRGEVPIGAGLSSSAAIEVATARALLGVSGITVAPAEIARLCQRAENEFVGVQCGIMDQFAACYATPGEALMLDCRSLEFRRAALPPGACLIVCNSMVKRELARSEYNRRRAECSAGVRHFPKAAALRDVTLSQLEQRRGDMDQTVYRRCRHVVGENVRVEQAFAALERRELDRFGELMLASHASLRDDFEVSCRELDVLVELASGFRGVYGCRMTGGGFGGCTVNLVQREHAEAFCQAIQVGYRNAAGIELSIYRV
jgi:galactokinase